MSPLKAIDPVAAKTIRDLLLESARRGMTILLTSHILALVDRIAGQLMMMRRGVILWQDLG